MELIPIENSTTIAGRGYDDSSRTMTIKFTSGTFYNYFDISLEEYNSVKDADSIGSKLKEVVKFKEYKKIS